MVEGELFPALRHFGIRFYAYNIVSLPDITELRREDHMSCKSVNYADLFHHSLHIHLQLAGGMLSGKYNLGDEKNEPEGRFFKTGGHWAQT